MNYITFGFSLISTSVIILGTLINCFENKLPAILAHFFRYGKFDVKQPNFFTKFIEVPKSWFKHFYILALFSYILTFTLVSAVYLLKYEVSPCIINVLNLVCGEGRVSFVSSTQVYVAISLMTLQVLRRFYDTHFISIFGKKSYIKWHQYIIGICYYPATILAILCEAPKFAPATVHTVEDVDLSTLTYFELYAVGLFLWAWWHQFTTTIILSNLRKNKKGKIVTDEHRLPHGDWFEYISSPPQAAEIIMYTSLTFILRYNITWFFVYAWVVVNQVETMLLSHWWYQENFKELPKKRKAIVPFVY